MKTLIIVLISVLIFVWNTPFLIANVFVCLWVRSDRPNRILMAKLIDCARSFANSNTHSTL